MRRKQAVLQKKETKESFVNRLENGLGSLSEGQNEKQSIRIDITSSFFIFFFKSLREISQDTLILLPSFISFLFLTRYVKNSKDRLILLLQIVHFFAPL